MSTMLADQHCRPCEGGVAPLDRDAVERLLADLDPSWRVSSDGDAIYRRFDFPAYSRTLGFANAVAWIAIREGHHPELVVNYGSCDVRWTTFAIGGLSENDFICAAKTDRLLEAPE
jgi:4a-hydroxytetrahydrobiopterin dehydratase